MHQTPGDGTPGPNDPLEDVNDLQHPLQWRAPRDQRLHLPVRTGGASPVGNEGILPANARLVTCLCPLLALQRPMQLVPVFTQSVECPKNRQAHAFR